MPVKRNPLLIPVAIIVGFGMLAFAVYLGLAKRSQQPATSAPSAGKSPGDQQSVPGANNRPDRRNRSALPHRRKVKRRAIALNFRDRWRGLRDQVAMKCRPQRFLKTNQTTWFVELPLELGIAPTGKISTVRSFGKPRLVERSGTYVPLSPTAAEQQELVQCYGAAIQHSIRFGESSAPRVKRYWLRVISKMN